MGLGNCLKRWISVGAYGRGAKRTLGTKSSPTGRPRGHGGPSWTGEAEGGPTRIAREMWTGGTLADSAVFCRFGSLPLPSGFDPFNTGSEEALIAGPPL